MRKLTVWNLMTLDGYFEGAQPWDLSWHPWNDDLERLSLEQLREADGLVFGRRTFTGMAEYWTSPTESGPITTLMNTIPKAVVSRTLTVATWNATVLPDLEALSRWLAAKRCVYVFGSAELVDGLLDAGLVDELRLGVVPVVLGRGKPLFLPREKPRAFNLLEVRPWSSGGTFLRLSPQKGE